MAINLDASTARIAWTTNGATAACHTGVHFALLHCTKGANLGAGDRSPAGKVKLFDAVELEGSVFLEATANEFDIGDRQIGMVQTTELMFYEFVYAGRRDTEGSCNLDLKAGFTANPSPPGSRISAHARAIAEASPKIFAVSGGMTSQKTTRQASASPWRIIPSASDKSARSSPTRQRFGPVSP